MGSPRRDGAGAARHAPRRFGDESGLTLIELMVSFSLLAVMLAATAGTLIAFTRTAAEDERRVQATAILNEVQERMQAAPWEVLGVYENELGPLDAIGEYVEGVDGDPGTLDGEELVELPTWDTDGTCSNDTFEEAVACGRQEGAPRTGFTAERDGRPYTINNVVTWVERGGEAIDIKRLTSVARWELLGREYEERFVSERAPASIETGNPQWPRMIQFDLESRNVLLTKEHQLPDVLEVRARFTSGVDRADLLFWVADIDEQPPDEEDGATTYDVSLREVSIELVEVIADPTDDTKHVYFKGAIPASSEYTFTDGPRKIRVVVDGEEDALGSRMLQLHGDVPHSPDPDNPSEESDAEVPDPDPPVITSTPTATPTTVEVVTDGGNLLSCQSLTISATVDGLAPSDGVFTDDANSVTMSYSAGPEQVENRPLVATGDLTGTNDQFSYTFREGKDHGFPAGHKTTFDIHVERVSGGEATQFGDVVFTFADAASC